MAYEGLNTSHPTNTDGATVLDQIRTQIAALRDIALMGQLQGWDLSVIGGTNLEPAEYQYVNGQMVLSIQLTWGSSGATDGKVTQIDHRASTDGGSTWDAIGTTTLSYNGDGTFAGAIGTAPALAVHWLLSLPGQIKAVDNDLQSHKSATDPHNQYYRRSGGESVSDINLGSKKLSGNNGGFAGQWELRPDGSGGAELRTNSNPSGSEYIFAVRSSGGALRFGVPHSGALESDNSDLILNGNEAWHEGNLEFSYDGGTQTLDITTS